MKKKSKKRQRRKKTNTIVAWQVMGKHARRRAKFTEPTGLFGMLSRLMRGSRGDR